MTDPSLSLSKSLIAELDQEAAGTRKVLERAPEDRYDWKPHEKSMSLGRLASHTAEMVGWGVQTVREDRIDLEPEDGEGPKPWNFDSRAELLEAYDRAVAEFRAALGELDAEAAGQPWSLLSGGQEIFTMPRAVVLRSMIFNHLIHHRAQLAVYLRLLDVPVPGLYGPSADEETFA